MPCDNLTPPCTPLGYTLEFYANPEALQPPSSSFTPEDSRSTMEASQPPSPPPTPEDSPFGFSCWIVIPPLSPGLCPWRLPAPASSAAVEVAFPVFPLSAADH